MNLTLVYIKNKFSARESEHCISSKARKTKGIVFSYRPTKHMEKNFDQGP